MIARRRSARAIAAAARVVAAAAALLGAARAGAQPPTSPASATGPDGSLSAEDQALVDAALEGEVIEVWGERVTKPFDRDTVLRLTGPELARRGVTNLADALALIPEIQVRAVNRGGQLADVRGARKGAVLVLLDGIPVGDPYRGNFDVSAVAITD